jgi:uncharacterized damage-inducible protein DinB
MNYAAHFSVLARYNLWATRRLLDAVAALSEDDYRRDLGLFFKSVHLTLNHLLVGEHMLWRERFMRDASPRVALNAEVQPDRELLAQSLVEGAATWLPWIQALPKSRFDENLTYVSMRGQTNALPFAATLSHVFNHATHHRGQITAALTQLGHACPELDMVYLLQEEFNR